MNCIKRLVNKGFSDRTPIWLMRQAGRYLPEYIRIKNKSDSFLEMCNTPSISAKITMLPIDRFNFDAAIIFSDILTIPYSLGLKLDFINGEGPVLETIQKNITSNTLNLNATKLAPVYNSLEMVRSMLPSNKCLIGFAGAPWTLLSYMIEGKSSKTFAKSKIFISDNKKDTNYLLDLLIEVISEHLINQIKAGASVVQIFDSWAGFLSEYDFNKLVIEPTKRIVSIVNKRYVDIPIIGFPRGGAFFYKKYAKETGVDVMGVDQFVPLSIVMELQKHVIIQGNLDPRSLLCQKEEIKAQVRNIEASLGRGRYIFNLGHGILPNTPIESVEYLVDLVVNG